MFYKYFCILIIFLLCFFHTKAQGLFGHLYHEGNSNYNEFGREFQATPGGGFLLYGENDQKAIITRKVDKDGKLQWQKIIVGEWDKFLCHTADGGFITAKFIANKNNQNIAPYLNILKIDQEGKLLWEIPMRGAYYYDNREADRLFAIGTNDSGCIMDVPTYFRCCFEGASMVKFNKNGKIEWEDGYSPSDESTLYIDNLIQTRDHGYFFSTSQYEHMGRSIIYFHKYSMDGHVEWASGGEVISSEYYSRLAEEDSGFVSYCYNAEFYGDKYNFQVERFNKAGVELSRKTIDTISTSPDHWNWGIPQAVKSLGSRGYLLLCSQYYDNAKDSGIFPTLCRTDTAENIIWQKYFPEVDSGVLTSMEVLQNGNYALFGYGKNNGIKNYYLLVTDSLGNTLNVQNSLSAQTGKLYPDPANDILHFDLGEIPSSSASIITISDLSGKILMQQNTSFKNSVADVSKLPDGVYIFQYRNPEKSWMGKFIISR